MGAIADRKTTLARLGQREFIEAFGLDRSEWRRRLGAGLVGPASLRFAERVIEFDEAVGEGGALVDGAETILWRFAGELTLQGLEHVPAEGPLMVVANHPGLTDAMSIWKAIGRRDLKVVAAPRELLEHLPCTREHLILAQGSATFRQALRHLKEGHSLLVFPAAKIEPDAALTPGDARRALDRWSPILFSLLKGAPSARLLPVAVWGVRSGITVRMAERLGIREPAARDWAGATLQVIFPRLSQVKVTVRVGPPIECSCREPELLFTLAINEMRRLLGA